MKVSLASLFAVVLSAGCGNGVAASPSVPTSGAQTSPSRSWIDPTATAENLLYVSTYPFQAVPDVEVYTWAERRYVGHLDGFDSPQHLCSDKAGNVFVPDGGKSHIVEYAHGGTSPIATLKDEGHLPRACFSDPATGDLAVVDAGGNGDVAIYRNASGSPTRYTDAHFAGYYFCGYDDAGDLFVDGKNHSDHFRFAELPKGANAFREIKLEPLNFVPLEPGSVQWDGKYMTVGDEVDNTANRYKISGTDGTFEGRADLDGGEGPVRQYWIPRFGHRVVNPQAKHIVAAQFHFSRFDFGDVAFWDYPHGGPAKHKIVGPDHPVGVTVSIAPK